jgi:hypothetical protein
VSTPENPTPDGGAPGGVGPGGSTPEGGAPEGGSPGVGSPGIGSPGIGSPGTGAPDATTDQALIPGTPENTLASMAEPLRYTRHLIAVYTVLGFVVAAALVGLVVLVIQPGHHASPSWSSWKPAPAGVAAMTKQISDHIASQYRMTEGGGQLLAVIPTDATIANGNQKVPLRAIAIRRAPQSNTGIRVIGTEKTRLYILCGLGKNCSIEGGKASQTRGRLVRREALEAALYTFKFVPSVDSVLAYMPPAPNSTTSQVLFLEKDALKEQLKQPIEKTLPLKTPPLPDAEDLAEAETIDKLTLKHVFDYEYQPIETGGALIILNPSK